MKDSIGKWVGGKIVKTGVKIKTSRVAEFGGHCH